MKTQLSIFDFQDQPVRVSMVNDQPWFVAADICRALEIGNASLAVNGNPSRPEAGGLDEEEKGVCSVNTLGGIQQLLCISESGLYALVFKSRKPQARAFRKWVTSEVLPAIRKTGRYEAEQALQASERGRLGRLRDILLSTADDVRHKLMTPGQAQAVAITAQRYLESIKLEGEALGYEKMFGLQKDEALGGLLSNRTAGLDPVQGLPQSALPAEETAEPDLQGGPGDMQEALEGSAPGEERDLPEEA